MRKIMALFLLLILIGSAGVARAVLKNEANDYIVVVVQEGDTLWDIAYKHNPGMDIRKYIYLIERRNNLSSPLIYPGQQLWLPK